MHAAMLRIDRDIDPVQRVAIGIVVANKPLVADLIERVIRAEVFLVDDQRARGRDQRAVDLDAQLALGKDRQLALELLARPRLDARERTLLNVLHRAQVALAQLAYQKTRP